MKVLIIGSRERYEKFCPVTTEFAKSVEKVYVDLGTSVERILEAAWDADFIAADAIAKVPADLILQMPNLKVIHSEGVAYNGIEGETAAERGIYVCNNRGINAGAVAEQTILLMLGLLRKVISGDRAVRDGRQIQVKEAAMLEGIMELGDCCIGLIGFGDIAKALSKRLQPFGCRVYYYTRNRKPEETEKEFGASWLPLSELLETCHMVSIHVPVTSDTLGMVNASFLEQMRPDAYLINTARGEIVDNEALRQALIQGKIAGAAFDTVAPEPVQIDNPLVTLPEDVKDKVIFSPHTGGITTSTFQRAHYNIWKAFEDVSCGRKPANVVNGI